MNNQIKEYYLFMRKTHSFCQVDLTTEPIQGLDKTLFGGPYQKLTGSGGGNGERIRESIILVIMIIVNSIIVIHSGPKKELSSRIPYKEKEMVVD